MLFGVDSKKEFAFLVRELRVRNNAILAGRKFVHSAAFSLCPIKAFKNRARMLEELSLENLRIFYRKLDTPSNLSSGLVFSLQQLCLSLLGNTSAQGLRKEEGGNPPESEIL